MFIRLFLLITLLQCTAFTQWTKVNLPPSDKIACLTNLGSKLYAGTLYNGVFVSTNNGSQWEYSGQSASVESFVSLGSYIFAASYHHIYRHDGTVWTNVTGGISSGNEIKGLCISGNDIFAGATPRGVYRSTNLGGNWTFVSNGLPYKPVYSLAACSDGRIAAATTDGVFVSPDQGETWNQYYPGVLSVIRAAWIDTLLIVGTNQGVYNGSSWSLTGYAIKSFALLNNYIFAGTGGGIFQSSDNGTTWNPVSNNLPANLNIRSLFVNGSTLFAGTDLGIFISEDNGASWNQSNSGLLSIQPGAVIANENYLFAACQEFGVISSNDAGATWKKANNGLTSPVFTFEKSGSDLFAGTTDGVFLTTDYGGLWEPRSNGLPWHFYVLSIAVSGQHLFAASDGIYHSSDYGSNWSLADTGDFSSVVIRGNEVFVAKFDGKVYRSDINGGGWIDVSAGLPTGFASRIYCLQTAGPYIFAATYLNGVYRLENGSYWIPVNTGIPMVNGIAAFALSGQYLFASGVSEVYYTSDLGENWNDLSEGLPPNKVVALTASDSLIYARAGSLYARPLSDLLISADEKFYTALTSYTLEQNYPNPFNPSTRIKYSITQLSDVVIKVFGVLGNEIETLVNEEKPAGTYELTWNAEGLPGGIYFYQLKAGQYTAAKKMILLK